MSRLIFSLSWLLVASSVFSAPLSADPNLWVKPRVYDGASSLKPKNAMVLQLRDQKSPLRGAHVDLRPPLSPLSEELPLPFSMAPDKIGFFREVPSLASEQAVSQGLDWSQLPDGRWVGHLEVRSPGALALRIGLRFNRLPLDTEFRFHDSTLRQIEGVSGQEIQLTLDRNRNAGDLSEEATLYWSPVIEGEGVGLEISLPPGVSPPDLAFRVNGISHLTVNPAQIGPQSQLPKAAASCNLDSRCYANWSTVSNSVARITFVSGGFSYLCTGTLLNDTAGSNTPYFLTANHCISTQTAASSLSSYWFYYSSSCNSGSVYSGMTQVAGGATLLYNSSSTDASFLKLAGNLPSGVTFSGWTTTTPSLGVSSTGLHNPTGDLQKISFWLTDQYETCQASGSGTFSCASSSQSAATFVNVSQVSGTTEGGSSGSGIFFDNNQYLFGQLYGGSASCSNPLGSTVYGLFSKTYANGNLGQWLATGKQSQTVTVTAPSALLVNQSASVTASASSGLSVSLSSATPSTCSVNGNLVTGLSSGTCTISGTQAGSDTYNSATGTASVTVSKADQTVTISLPSSLAVYQTATVSTSASSGLTVSLATSTPTTCTVSGSLVTGVSAGVCTLRGTQAGNATYNSASASGSINVTKASQTIALNAPSALDWGNSSTISATATSGLPVTLSSQTPSICSLVGNTLTGTYPGNCSLIALQSGNAAYLATTNQASLPIEVPVYPTPSRNLKVKVLGQGSVTSSPVGIACGSYCALAFSKGGIVQLEASPLPGYQFVRWQGACNGRATLCKIRMSQAKSVVAIFK